MDANKKVNIHSGHRKRVKANVVNNGYSQLEDHRLLELILFYSIPQADTNELAHNLLAEFGSFDGIMKADIERLSVVKGVGENTAVLLSAIGEMNSRALKVRAKRQKTYTTTDDYRRLALDTLSEKYKENIVLFCFDSSERLLKTAHISEGNGFSADFDLRLIVKAVMNTDAAKAVIAHNHPYGKCEHSLSDLDATRKIAQHLRQYGVPLADHIIVNGKNETYSMYEESEQRMIFF